MGINLSEIVMIGFSALVLTFMVCMFVDAIKNKALSDTYKSLWIIGMLVFPVATLLYYFTQYRGTFSIKGHEPVK